MQKQRNKTRAKEKWKSYQGYPTSWSQLNCVCKWKSMEAKYLSIMTT